MGRIQHVVESPDHKPISAKQAMKIVQEKGFFGYHPAGYGGFLYRPDYSMHTMKDSESEVQPSWLWIHASSCS